MAFFKGIQTKIKSRTRSDRRRSTKAKYRKGSATWCHIRGMKAHGEGGTAR